MNSKADDNLQLNPDETSVLRYALTNGILDLDRVHEMCMSSKRERVRTLHKYSITPPAKDGDRWRTNYVDKDGKRKTLRAPTEEELLNKPSRQINYVLEKYAERNGLKTKKFSQTSKDLCQHV